jgi:hypothetical protein
MSDRRLGTAPKYTLEDKQMDAKEAFERAQWYHRELEEIYRYFMPFRRSTHQRSINTGGQTEGAKRTDYLFDSTGPSSAFAFVANMKADWMPAFDDFFKLENGPLYIADDAAERNEALQRVTKAAHGLLVNVRNNVDEMFADLFGGTGAMLITRGDRRGLIRGVAVPTIELALDTGPWGGVERWYWRRRYRARELEQLWPDGKFGDRLARLMREKRNDPVDVMQYTYWDPRDEMFKLCVWADQDHATEFHTEALRVTPWVTPRMFVVPGEAMGRGLAHLGLPNVKTLNKARELALRAAAFALLGLWVRRNDNVFNPDNAPMTPGAMWKVAYADGPLRSIQRLDVPHNFDISTVVINDEREQLRRVLLDDELPEVTDRVRSPTEIAGRMRRYDRNRGGATTRLALELVTPLVQRTVDLMGQQGMLPANLEVDQILTQATVAAPAAAAQRTDKVERIVSWIQIMTGLFGPQAAALNAKIEEILPELGRYAGVEERFIRSKTEADQLKALIDQAVQQAVAQEREAQKAAPAAPVAEAPEQAPGQSFFGGMAA